MALPTLLITGGAGFIGSHLVEYLLETWPSCAIVNVDKLTYAGRLENLQAVAAHPRYTFVQGDICDATLIAHLFEKYDIRGVFHLAAQTHVDNSIVGPQPFLTANTVGTFTLLEAARRAWMLAPGHVKPGYETARFHYVSTDEVYGSLPPGIYADETAPILPSSPYSAGKASGDLWVRAYYQTYGLNVTISRCSNNFGPRQHGEKLIPTLIRCALSGQPLPIYGDGQHARDWLYVRDHCTALVRIWQAGKIGEVYNVGAQNERTNLHLAQTVCRILDELHPSADGTSYARLISFVKDRAGHDRRYALNADKLRALGWQPQTDFETGLYNTVKWYLKEYVR